MREIADRYDVIVAGGGPAGAAAATLVAQNSPRVLLLERAPEPQFKIGESLMPATYWTLERLGVLERMSESHFPKKFSVQFFTADGRASSPFYFRDRDEHVSSQTWQVVRSEFDQMLLDNAASHGVDVRRGWSVREVLLDRDSKPGRERAVGVAARTPEGETREIASKVVVDATGQSALISRRLKLKEGYPRLRNVSYFSHFEGGRRDEGIDGGATLIFHTEGGKSWFWSIPQPGDRVSVGVVGPLDHLVRNRSSDPQTVFDEELARCPALVERLEGARRTAEIRVAKDFSYFSRRIAGDGWVLAGDAFGFIDPIYSSGVFLALKSGEMAADSILEGLAEGDLSGEVLGRHGDEYLRGMDAIRRLVHAYYDPAFSFGKFLKRYPDCRDQVVDLLVGNVYRRPVEGLLAALDEFADSPMSSESPTSPMSGRRPAAGAAKERPALSGAGG